MRPVVAILLLLNSAVFFAWQYYGASPWLTEHFLVSWDGLVAGRPWTLLTSEFSHIAFPHFLLNMLVLASFGPIVEDEIGGWRFLVFYLVAACVASLGHAGVSAFLMDKPALPALGASGAISGVVLLFAFMFPQARILLFGLIPMSALVGALLFVGLDIVGLVAQFEGSGLPIGHGAHLGGAATGTLYYFFVVRHQPRRSDDLFDVELVAEWKRLAQLKRRKR